MIQRALRLKDAIHGYCKRWRPEHSNSYDLMKDVLDATDWDELQQFEQLLKPFEKATKRAEGNAITGSHGALWEVIPVMDYLFNTLKRHADDVTAAPGMYSDHYANCINHGFVKLQGYYTKIDDSRFYSASTALNPYMKFNYFNDAWSDKPGGRDAIANARRMTHELYREYLARVEPPPPRASTTPTPTSLFVSKDEDDPLWAATFGKRTTNSEQERKHTRKMQETELERYMSDTLDLTTITLDAVGKIIHEEMEPLQWWRERGEQLYPTLTVMAYDLFAMPAMSSECERAFSNAKRLVTDERHRLKSDIIEADQCIKSWLKNGIADGQAIFTNIAAALDEDNEIIVEITQANACSVQALKRLPNTTYLRLECLPQCDHGAVLVTSRTREVAKELVYWKDIIAVKPMNEEQALTLLCKKLDTWYTEQHAPRLAQELDFMPLALAQAAAYICQSDGRCSIQQYLVKLKQCDKSEASVLDLDE